VKEYQGLLSISTNLNRPSKSGIRSMPLKIPAFGKERRTED